MSNFSNYFDNGAATPLLTEVYVAMKPYLKDRFYNASALYLGAKQNRQVLEQSRQTIAQGLGAQPTEIIFTAGGTEANNLAINGIMDQHKDSQILFSQIEHESIIKPAQKYNNLSVRVDKNGIIKLDDLKTKVTNKTILISVIYANNEIGSIQPLKDISEFVKEVKQKRLASNNKLPLYFHTDACQAINYLDMQVSRLGIDLMTINAGKIYGPKQCGALYVKKGIILSPMILGGGQEWGMRSGTENIANIVGFATAWQIVRQNYKEEAYRLSKLRDDFIKKVNSNVTCVLINGQKNSKRLANNIHLTFAGQDNETLVMMLDELGFQVGLGSACSASKDKPSYVLKAIGLTDTQAQNSLRISMGRFTTQSSLNNLYFSILKLVAKK